MAMHVMTTDELSYTNGRRRGTSTLLTWLKRTLSNLADSLAWYHCYRENVRELENLSDRELDDIGISRWDIPTIAMKSANSAQASR